MWHLFSADLRWHRVPLAIWVVVVAANTAVEGGRALVDADPRLREAAAVAASLLWLAELLLAFLVVSVVIHAHPAVGTEAFWLTRPIPRRRLWVAKIGLLVLALVVVPLIAYAVRLGAHHMPAAITAGVLAQNALIDSIWVALIAVAAALTPNFARFALLIGGALLSFAILIGLMIAIAVTRSSEGPPTAGGSIDDGPTSLFVFAVSVLLAAVTMMAVQYETRLRYRSVLTGVAGVAVAYLISSLWPVPFLSVHRIVPDWARDERTLSLAIDTTTISTNAQHLFFPDQRRQWNTVNGRVKVEGLRPEWTGSISIRDASVRLRSGETIPSAGNGGSNLLFSSEGAMQPRAAIVRVLDVAQLATAIPPAEEPRPEHLPALFWIEQQELARLSPATGDYLGRLRLTLTHYTVDGTLPLQPGATHQRAGYRLVLDRVSHDNGRELSLIARETRAASMWERRPPGFYTFYLRNRERREALEVGEYPLLGSFTLMRFLPFEGVSRGQDFSSGFFSRAIALTFPPRYVPRAETLAADPSWLADAELVIVRRTEEGSVERTVAVSSFPVGNARTVTTGR